MDKALVLVENGFEDRELFYPFYRLQEACYDATIVGPSSNTVYRGVYGVPVTSDASPQDINVEEFKVLVIPGGRAPDRMRIHKEMVKIVREAFRQGKILAAICHGPQLLIEADVLHGRRATCYQSVATDLKNAGGIYEDNSVVVDRNLVTSRFPADLPQFCKALIGLL